MKILHRNTIHRKRDPSAIVAYLSPYDYTPSSYKTTLVTTKQFRAPSNYARARTSESAFGDGEREYPMGDGINGGIYSTNVRRACAGKSSIYRTRDINPQLLRRRREFRLIYDFHLASSKLEAKRLGFRLNSKRLLRLRPKRKQLRDILCTATPHRYRSILWRSSSRQVFADMENYAGKFCY